MKYTLEELDAIKTKILKYILYKKRTEQEVRLKFSKEDNELLEEAISYLKEAGYINDEEYVSKAINEYINLKNLSLKEIKYKLLSRGIEKDIIDEYIYNHSEELSEYELASLKKIISKKYNLLEYEELFNYLLKKGFKQDIIKQALDERYSENE